MDLNTYVEFQSIANLILTEARTGLDNFLDTWYVFLSLYFLAYLPLREALPLF